MAIPVFTAAAGQHFPPGHAGLGELFRAVDTPAKAEAIVVNAGFNRTISANLAAALGDPGVRQALRGGAAVVFDSAREGRAFDPRIAEDLHTQLDAAAVAPDRCVLLTQNTSFATHYAAWRTARGVQAGLAVHVLHAHLRVLALRAQTIPACEPAVWNGGDAAPRFLSLNRRMTPHRVVILGHLFRRQSFDRGLVSALEVPPAGSLPSRWERRFSDEIAAFRDLSPQLPLLLHETQRSGHVFGWNDAWYQDTAFSFTTETDFDAAGVCRFTEKSLKPLLAGHPMLLAGLPGTLELLRSYGFRTFAPWFREDYDEIADPTLRMQAILAEFDRLMAMPVNEFRDLIRQLRPILMHNTTWFANGLAERLAEEDRAAHAAVAAAAGRP